MAWLAPNMEDSPELAGEVGVNYRIKPRGELLLANRDYVTVNSPPSSGHKLLLVALGQSEKGHVRYAQSYCPIIHPLSGISLVLPARTARKQSAITRSGPAVAK